jgi:TPR repeat protein
MRRGLLALAVSVVMVGVALAGPLEEGFAASQRRDYQTALTLWLPLAQRGNADAQFGIGMLYYHGHGVPQSYADATRWLLQAADEGHYSAQFTVGSMYEHGIGVPQDFAEAHMWFNLATARAGRAQWRNIAARARDHVAIRMTPEQIAEARRLAREWEAAHPVR